MDAHSLKGIGDVSAESRAAIGGRVSLSPFVIKAHFRREEHGEERRSLLPGGPEGVEFQTRAPAFRELTVSEIIKARGDDAQLLLLSLGRIFETDLLDLLRKEEAHLPFERR